MATDAHSNHNRTPELGECIKVITKKLGEDYVERYLIENPEKMLRNEFI